MGGLSGSINFVKDTIYLVVESSADFFDDFCAESFHFFDDVGAGGFRWWSLQCGGGGRFHCWRSLEHSRCSSLWGSNEGRGRLCNKEGA